VNYQLLPGECYYELDVRSLVAISAECSTVKVDPTGPYPIGPTDVTVTADDGGEPQKCIVTVNINEFASPVSSLACNNLVNVSLDDGCEAFITADMVLEGGPYGCYEGYNVIIEGITGNVITSPGDYSVTIEDPFSNNACWGVIRAEDKLPPLLRCEDVTTDCAQGFAPDDPIFNKFILSPSNNPGTIPDGSGRELLRFDAPHGYVHDVRVRLEIQHGSVSQLRATLEAPSGAKFKLFSYPGTSVNCDENDIDIELSDDADRSHAQLQMDCYDRVPSIYGSYQPEEAFSNFDAEVADGQWKLRIHDDVIGTQGSVISAELEFILQTGLISFPILSGVPIPDGDNSYIIDGNNDCEVSRVTYEDNMLEFDCSSQYSYIIERTWWAYDKSNNHSTCLQTIYVVRKDLEHLAWPPNYDDLEKDAFNCKDILSGNVDLDEGTGHPSPSVTGYPIDWSSLDFSFCDNVQKTYEDTRIDICPGSYKIIRKWLVLDWCTGEVAEHNQIIKILDNDAPDIICPEDFTISTDPYYCGALDVFIPLPDVTFDCSQVHFELAYKYAGEGGEPQEDTSTEGVDYVGGGYTIEHLPYGKTWLVYTAWDECGNSEQCTFEVDVEDDIEPVAVCDEHTVVSVGADGMAFVNASTFDDGSSDNCGIAYWEARKMTDECNEEPDLEYHQQIKFCCEEVGSTIMVAFRVVDINGNSNTCMVEVEVQDKLPPFITCPPDVTLWCQEDFKDLDKTGSATAIDNCGDPDITFEDSGSLDQCGRGEITRTWTAEDAGGLKHSCYQYITLIDPDPFDGLDTLDLWWPQDTVLIGCDAADDPDAAGHPIIYDDECSLVAYNYEDQVFEFVDDACRKILRHWTVIDWCTYNDDNPTLGQGWWEYVQIIKVNNLEGPVFTGTTCADITICSYGLCGDYLDLTIGANDDCTPEEELQWSWAVDLDPRDHVYDSFGFSNDAYAWYPDGTHTIRWTVEDRCGNQSVCEYDFTVVDCKNPTPYCVTSITTVVMPNSGQVTVWANDFDFGSSDNCTSQDNLIFSFSSTTSDQSTTFYCDDIPNGVEEEIDLEMWVTDEEGNQDYCSIVMVLQDNNGDKCDDQEVGTALISGLIQTEDNNAVEEVSVQLNSNQPEFPRNFITDFNGDFAFTHLDMGRTYEMTSQKDDNALNGVSTLDLVLMQKHILGIDPFDSAYKVIASDVDNNEKVTAADLVNLRRIILGIEDEFSNGQSSWRFVKADVNYANINDPFPFQEIIEVNSLQGNMLDADFMAVKIGDVNGSAETSQFGQPASEIRTNASMTLAVDEIAFKKGEIVEIPVYANQFENISGYQFTLNFTETNVAFEGVKAASLNLDESNFGAHRANQGFLTTSWNNSKAISLDNDEVMFTLIFKALQDGTTIDLFNVTSQITQAEAYGEGLNVMDVKLVTRDAQGQILAENFDLFQNQPNPFSGKTTVGFNLPKAAKASLTIYDVTGKVVFKNTDNYSKGYNTVELNKSDMNTSGILYYKLETDEFTATKKMIGLD
jgi:subtilisin-like proprotein convertase family protein